MLERKKKKVKAIYYNELCCPECGLPLQPEDKVYLSSPIQHYYYCNNCNFKTISHLVPGLEYEFEEEN